MFRCEYRRALVLRKEINTSFYPKSKDLGNPGLVPAR
jgi:hypothetical protein